MKGATEARSRPPALLLLEVVVGTVAGTARTIIRSSLHRPQRRRHSSRLGRGARAGRRATCLKKKTLVCPFLIRWLCGCQISALCGGTLLAHSQVSSFRAKRAFTVLVDTLLCKRVKWWLWCGCRYVAVPEDISFLFRPVVSAFVLLAYRLDHHIGCV